MIKEMGFDEKPHRILVCMSDWIFGQVIMIEDLVSLIEKRVMHTFGIMKHFICHKWFDRR